MLRMFEARHSDFGKRIDVDQLASVLFCAFKRCEHARMICARVLTDDEDCLCFVEIF